MTDLLQPSISTCYGIPQDVLGENVTLMRVECVIEQSTEGGHAVIASHASEKEGGVYGNKQRFFYSWKEL